LLDRNHHAIAERAALVPVEESAMSTGLIGTRPSRTTRAGPETVEP
jgi:hypothetical protein